MAILKCKMCGGDIQATDGAAYGTCASCGTTSTLPKATDERKANLFNRANHFRRQNDFDKAVQAYENILNDDNKDAEAHWGVVLSRYGIEYVEDPVTHQRVPTCHRVQSESILKDADYLETLQHAPDEYTKSLYEEEAKRISEIQKGILAISKKEKPYDVFICYKESTDSGSRTKDSTIAQDIYYELTKDGYKVFFAKITLEDKLGQQYEPYIFSALNSAKVMLVIGTKKEHFEAVWVKNEWSRFLAIMKKDRSRLLIPCYRDMDAYDIPDELSNLQSQDMSKVGFMQDILRGIKKILDAGKSAEEAPPATAAGAAPAAPGVESLMKRGKLFLEDSDWKQANEYFDKVLDIDPEYAPAYAGKLCAELKVRQEEMLGDNEKPLSEFGFFQKAVRFANANYHTKLEGYNKSIQDRIADELRKEQERVLGLVEIRKKITKFQKCVSAGGQHTVALKTDSTVVAIGSNEYSQCSTKKWQDFVAVAVGHLHTVGLKADGTVVAVGWGCNTITWRDIIAITAGYSHTVGLKSDGTVVATGNNENNQCNTESWLDIIAVAASNNVSGYSIDGNYTVGLKADGTVVAVGVNEYGQCNTGSWRDIVAITAGSMHTVGLKADGTVVTVGANEQGQCNTENWRDIVAIAAGFLHTVGLKADGTVVAVGSGKDGQCKTEGWRDIGPVSEEQIFKSKQSLKWQQQGLCRYCGCKLSGVFPKKCKSCGKAN
jgi:tetratricopeptide (TPR) repeat protein